MTDFRARFHAVAVTFHGAKTGGEMFSALAVFTRVQESGCWSDERWIRVSWICLSIELFRGVLKQWVGV